MMAAKRDPDARPAAAFVERRVNPARERDRLQRDLLSVESALELAQRHADRLRDLRDRLAGQLVALDD